MSQDDGKLCSQLEQLAHIGESSCLHEEFLCKKCVQFNKSRHLLISRITHIFSTESAISGQNSSTISFNFWSANSFSSMFGSSRRAMTPTRNKKLLIIHCDNKLNHLVINSYSDGKLQCRSLCSFGSTSKCKKRFEKLTSRCDGHLRSIAILRNDFQHDDVYRTCCHWPIWLIKEEK